MSVRIVALISCLLTILGASTGSAGVVGAKLESPTVDFNSQTATFDITTTFEDGGDLFALSIDVQESSINGVKVSDIVGFDYTVFDFSPGSIFTGLGWATLSDFGTSFTAGPPFNTTYGESVFRYDSGGPPNGLGLTDSQVVPLGVLTFDFSTLGLSGGDEFTIDIKGVVNVDPTTSVTFNPSDPNEPASLALPLTFDGPYGPEAQTVILPADVTQVPEPTSIAAFALLGLVALRYRKS